MSIRADVTAFRRESETGTGTHTDAPTGSPLPAEVLSQSRVNSGALSSTSAVDAVSSHSEIRSHFVSPFSGPPTQSRGTRASFLSRAKWRGTVVSVSEETFTAQLEPLVGSEGRVDADLYFEDLTPADRPLVVPGARFYWTIGYLDGESGQRLKSDILRFQRTPPPSASELREADRQAEALLRVLDSE